MLGAYLLDITINYVAFAIVGIAHVGLVNGVSRLDAERFGSFAA